MRGLTYIRLAVVLVVLTITAVWGSGAQPQSASAGYLPGIRFYEGTSPTGRLLFTLERLPYRVPTWGIFYGTYSQAYFPLYAYNHQYVFDGPSYYDDFAFRFELNTVYEGAYVWGEPVLHFEGDRLFLGGNTIGEIAFTIRGDRVFEGPNTGGAIVVTADRDIISFPGPTPLVVGLVLAGYLPLVEPSPPTPPPPPPGAATATPTPTETLPAPPAATATPTSTATGTLPPPAPTATPTDTPTETMPPPPPPPLIAATVDPDRGAG